MMIEISPSYLHHCKRILHVFYTSFLLSPPSVSLISWESSGNSSWQFSLAGRVSLPVVDFTGGIIATDGDTLVGYDADGNPVGAPIPLYPIRGEVCDLTITPDSIVIIMYKCGFFASYMASKSASLAQKCDFLA